MMRVEERYKPKIQKNLPFNININIEGSKMRDQSLLVNINIQMVDSVSASSHRTEPEPVTMQSNAE